MSVVDLAAARMARTPHNTGDARCLGCLHKWCAVAPVGVVVLECPSCGLERGRFMGNCLRENAKHWTCNCGNDLFHVTPDGTYCPGCGVWQDFAT